LKLFTLTLILLLPQWAFCLTKIATPDYGDNPLLRCLAKEEGDLNRYNSTGPLYKLNQLFIEEFSALDEVMPNVTFLSEICSSKDYSPSVSLLRLMLLHGRDVFDLKHTDVRSKDFVIQKSLMEGLIDRAPAIFFEYISNLQAKSPSAGCLLKKIPELAKFSSRFQDLESEKKPYELVRIEEVSIIFNQLKNFDRINLECLKEKKAAVDKAKAKNKGQMAPTPN
ncbi:MAG: hypothetical protein WCG27_12335, partial [Pseudomonadota bacterium]